MCNAGCLWCVSVLCRQLQNQSELRAPTAEKAAFFLDAAIASRRSSRSECDEEELRNSHMLFTLHIYQYRMEKSGKAGSEQTASCPPVSTTLGQPHHRGMASHQNNSSTPLCYLSIPGPQSSVLRMRKVGYFPPSGPK